MRKSILLAVLVVVALAAVPAFASVQNVKVGGSIDSTWLYRENFDFGADVIGDEVQNLFITQTMLTVDADLTDNVSTSLCLINERAWNQKDAENANDSDVDIHLAFVTLREMLYSPLTVVVGRQAFHYGNSFIVDSAGTNNSAPTDSGIDLIAGDLTKQTAQDAIRLVFDYDPLSLELLFSKIDSNTNTLVNDDSDDIDLYGVNAGYEVGDSFNTQVEAYFFAKVDKSTDAINGTTDGTDQITSSKSDTVYVPGLRASTTPIEGLNVQAEIAWQRGNRVATSTLSSTNANRAVQNEKRDAMAGQFIANYQVPVLEEYKPVAQYAYTYVSGDSNPNDRGYSSQSSANRHTAWDPMYENQGSGAIYNAIFNLTNLHVHGVSLQANPIEDVTTKLSWIGFWLDKKIDTNNGTLALVQPDGINTGNLGVNRTEEDVGYEVDFEAIYDYTEDVQFGANFGWFVPGDVFTTANNDVASQAIVHGNVNF